MRRISASSVIRVLATVIAALAAGALVLFACGAEVSLFPVGLAAALASTIVTLGLAFRERGVARDAAARLFDEFREGRFDARLAPADARRLGEIAERLHGLGAFLAADHAERAQKERLLQTIVDNAPMAIVVYGDTGKILHSNAEAREVFFEGQSLEGHNFLRLLEAAPAALRQGLLTETDALFTVEQEGELGTYHLAKRYFDIQGEPHTLLMVKHLTEELGRQEIEVWKKVIRLINHELNNSLAPISSMVHSARVIAKNPEQLAMLGRVFDTIEERTSHLAEFLEGYARFARLPKPRQEEISWSAFLESIRLLFPNVKVAAAPAGAAWFDRGQMHQVLINVLKNATESGSPADAVELSVATASNGSAEISVADRGKGMTDEVLRSALVPFFSTKDKGTGLGLALCREIVEAHGGKLRIARREGGGIVVSFKLPGRDKTALLRTGRLTLTRG